MLFLDELFNNPSIGKTGIRKAAHPHKLIKEFKNAKNQPGLKNVTTSPNGLKLSANLAEEYYTSPLDGMFTSKNWADAVKVGDAIVASGITRSLPYRALMLVPKGLSQAGKTILGPFTHMRNFFSAVVLVYPSTNTSSAFNWISIKLFDLCS